MVRLMYNNQLIKVNQAKVRKDHDEWHDVPLPPALEEPLMRPEGNPPAIPDAPAPAIAAATFKASFQFRQPVARGPIDL